MKTKTSFFLMLIFACSLLYGQQPNFEGSWIGTVHFSNQVSLRVLLNFAADGCQIRGTFDSPDQGMKGFHIDSVWVAGDSIFTNHESVFGPGILFRGKIIGDSVIDGRWMQFPLRLSSTSYAFDPERQTNPQFDGSRIIKLIESTPLKDQQNTGTCWGFATTSFIETEAIRLGKKPVVLSPMFYVAPTYIDKAERYIRLQGNMHFSEGDLTFSALKAYKEFGAVPEVIFSGLTNGFTDHDHSRMNMEILKCVKSYVSSGRGKMTREDYRKSIAGILEKSMGKAPESFFYQGKQYTPKSFAEKMIGINPDDYVEITSFSLYPFYSKFILEMISNWNHNRYLNLPIDELASTVDHALMNSYSVCWDGDIYEGCKDHFCKLDEKCSASFDAVQQARQVAFDNFTLEDYHNMHIIGLAENSEGERFYILKNSNGNYWYMSRGFFLMKTISVMVHKEAIPGEISKKVKW